jgi:glutamate 5-kinase
MKTLVVKIGSSTVADARGRMRRRLLNGLVGELADLVETGHRVVLVSSGAIACGQSLLGLTERPRAIPDLQAASAIGQGRLFDAYARLLARKGVRAGQVLLTSQDFGQRASYVNARNTLRRLLGWRIVPIVNENDTTATDEIRFGDNDVLAAQVAIMLRADLLLLLTDRAGLFTADPRSHTGACLIARVEEPGDLAGVEIGERTRRGAGGMRGKVAAALMAAGADVRTVIADGARPNVVHDALVGAAVGTEVVPRPVRLSAFKLWLRHAKPVRGTLEVDEGAQRALATAGGSLLPVGVTAVHGSFAAGDAVSIVDAGRHEIARGIATMSARDVRRAAGRRSDEVRLLLPHLEQEVVHRDRLVLTSEEDA